MKNDSAASATAISVVWLMALLMLAGVALDAANGFRVRAMLQATADSAALAAVLRIENPAAARAAAHQLAELNMPAATNGDVLPDANVELGLYEPATGIFLSGMIPYNAARVTVRRGGDDGGLEVPTFLLGITGFDAWNVAASAMAAVRPTAGGGGDQHCAGGLILSQATMQMGGGNTLRDGMCIHGEQGVHFGGASWFTEDVRVSALLPLTIVMGTTRSGSAPASSVKQNEPTHLEPLVLPRLNDIFSDLWTELNDSGVDRYYGDLVPDFLKNAEGFVNVVRVDNWWWTVQPGDLQPHTVYMVNHGMQLAGGVSAANVGLVVKGQIGMGGGPGVTFDKVYFFGEGALNFSGDAAYGQAEHFCEDGEYDVYLMSKDAISLGGWGDTSWTHAMMAIAPTFAPGGAMKNAGGIYAEARNTIQMGGNVDLAACGNELSGHYETVKIGDSRQLTFGAALVR
ncbi:MAG: TadG family pilus assembly protein [Pseudomonadota bacterium]|nr:TadG family pilus assembly protein [Pseudomonadota bacterium]MEE3099357.1 TadG family pilus assembly protein [Pseudomonadota bacterium]